ncbi:MULTISPECIES: hypothetical protein [unclassified Bradyrhizobium]|uniref:hypothetical protein n=1 Tax=unclassified Bradyrhizobium TaxID=2631580 RepID=UPI00209C89FA|nr:MULTISPECIES: hypothetical protein [unclassified Bradyrhizobium]MCP1838902.1 hypothetical protein [Bradyrhizobium sp. USDA 4538]MCP1899469.1 hypothetical protein [Bradyrhizobium sp. USDA 4537]MCP1986420.1 hypothetical protein [Bradyrhizobium sp. USDA 4539]
MLWLAAGGEPALDSAPVDTEQFADAGCRTTLRAEATNFIPTFASRSSSIRS